MSYLKVTFLFVTIFVMSNGFFLPPNVEGGGFKEHFLNQKFNFLEDKFKGSPVDFDLIKQKIEAKKLAEAEEETNENDPEDPNAVADYKMWFLQNKLSGPKFDFIKEKIESKQTALPNNELDIFNQKVTFLENLLNERFDKQTSNHQIAKRSTKNQEEGADPAAGAAIGNYFLTQKLSFLENKFKGTLVDFDAIKAKIDAKKEAKKQEEAANTPANQEENLSNLLNYLKQLHAQKLSENHQVAKRSVEENTAKDPAAGAAIGNYFLNQKLSFLENKFKGTPIDFETIKGKIEAKKEAKLQEETENAAVSGNAEKFALLQNFFKQMSADQLKSVIDKIEGNHSVAKRSVKAEKEDKKGGSEYGAAKRDHFLKQKNDFLSNKFKQMNMDSDTLMQKIQSKQKGGQ